MLFLVCLCSSLMVPALLQPTNPELTRICLPGRFGEQCQYKCHCKGTNSCSQQTGSCASHDCAKGYVGDGCQNVNLAHGAVTTSAALVDSDPGSCHTESVQPHHWVKLRNKFWLRRFRVHVKDHPKRLKEAQVYLQVTNSSEAQAEWMTSSNARMTWSGRGEVDIFLEHPVQGSYVWLKGSGVDFCELYVFGGRNVALFRPTAQSSTLGAFRSGLAVDGVTSQRLEDGSCSHTARTSGLAKLKELFKEHASWWRLNLTAPHVATRLIIYNRAGYEGRLRWFHLRAGSEAGSVASLRTVYESPDRSPPAVLDIIPLTPLSLALLQLERYGRKEMVTICELQLFGDCPDMTYGPSCNMTCSCAEPEEVCDSFSGSCVSGQRSNGSTPTPLEDGNSNDDNNADSNLPAIISVPAVLVIAVLIAALRFAVCRYKGRSKTQEASEGDDGSSPPEEDGHYEVVVCAEAAHRDQSSRGAPDDNNTTYRSSRKSSLSALLLCGSCSTTRNNDSVQRKNTTREKKRTTDASTESETGTASPQRPSIPDFEPYEDADSSGGACARGAESRGGEMYDTLGNREYETPYTVFKAAAKKTCCKL